MVDRPLLATGVAAIRDAVDRIRSTLPQSAHDFAGDRTAREVITLNLFVALQECIAIAGHWLADEGWAIPNGYRDMFLALADHGVLERELAERLADAAGLRNLVAHRYGTIDWARIHAIAATELDDLVAYCEALSARALADDDPRP